MRRLDRRLGVHTNDATWVNWEFLGAGGRASGKGFGIVGIAKNGAQLRALLVLHLFFGLGI